MELLQSSTRIGKRFPFLRYLKYFSPDGYMLPSSVDGGILGQFYSSFQPSVARRNSLAADEDSMDFDSMSTDFAQIRRSLQRKKSL